MRVKIYSTDRTKLSIRNRRSVMDRCPSVKLNTSQTFSNATFIRLLEDGDHRTTEDGALRILE